MAQQANVLIKVRDVRCSQKKDTLGCYEADDLEVTGHLLEDVPNTRPRYIVMIYKQTRGKHPKQ